MVAIFISALPNIMFCTKLEFINTVEAKEGEKEKDLECYLEGQEFIFSFNIFILVNILF